MGTQVTRDGGHDGYGDRVIRRTPPATAGALLTVLLLVGGGCSTGTDAPATPTATAVTRSGEVAREALVRQVLAISVDGLSPRAIRRLGPDRAPHLHRLLAEGAGTLNARTEQELTVTLPNHTGMLTGRRVDRSQGGHGIFFNEDRGGKVSTWAGHPVKSVFNVVHRAGGRTALFASKSKFALFNRSWHGAIDRFTMNPNNGALVKALRTDLRRARRNFTFLHLSAPDTAGHAHGFMSEEYLLVVRRTDRRVGAILRTIDATPALRRHLDIVLTSDHGGRGDSHQDPTRRANYRVPFLAWGPRVAVGADLYDLNPDYLDPGKKRTAYDTAQPVRNGDVANLATDLLGLGAVPGSEHDAQQDLDVKAR